jgi:Uma2 family endonuclease
MATVLNPAETLPIRELDSDAAELYEVVDGRVVENPGMGALQSILATYLDQLMGPFARAHQLGWVAVETLFLLDSARRLKRRPDLAFVSIRRWPLELPIPPTECWEVVPDLAVEFISESNTAAKVDKKIDEFFQAGVAAVWVVFPETRKVYVYDSPTQVHVLRIGDELDGGAIVPGFRLPVTELFHIGAEGSKGGSSAGGSGL